MCNYRLVEVADSSSECAFYELPVELYRGNEYWVHPLRGDMQSVFDKDKNPLYKAGGELCRWILLDNADRCVGRVAAFVNPTSYLVDGYKVGQMGFFECIDDYVAAKTLIDCAKDWLLARGMECMEGPVNFGERMMWWGLLNKGFDEAPVYGMPYTHQYYVKFFEEYGFKNYYNQLGCRTKLAAESLSKVVIWKADRILQDPNYLVVNFAQIGEKKAIDSILTVYNKAWNVEVHGVQGADRAEIMALYKSLKPVIDKNLIYFAYYQNEPIGFFLMFPEMNQVFKKLNGKIDFIGAVKLFYSLKFKKIDVALGQLFGIVPEFQNKGVEAALIKKFYDDVVGNRFHYKELELNWIGDFNPPMVHLMDYIGASQVRIYTTYRYMLNSAIPFERSVDRMKRLKEEKIQIDN